MKMKSIFLISALSLLAVSAIGVGVGLQANNKAEEVRADTATDFIYLVNSDWYDSHERYAAYFFTDGVGSEWVNFTWDASLGYNKVAIPTTSYDKVILCRMDGGNNTNDWANRWAQTANLDNHTGMYKPYNKDSGASASDGEWQYILTVGEETTYMVPYNSSKVFRGVTAKANDAVSLKANDKVAAGTLYPEALAANNMTSSKTIKVGGSVEIHVTKEGWSTWVTGYGPASVTLQDFCDAILDAECSVAGLAGVGSSSAYTSLTSADKVAFNEATVLLGNGKTYPEYGNVVNEAATRYAHLVNDIHAEPLADITVGIAPRISYAPAEVQTNSATIIIVLASAVTLAAVGGYFLLRKRED